MNFNILANGGFTSEAGEDVDVFIETTRWYKGEPKELRFVKDGAVIISCEGQLIIDKLHNTRAVVRIYSDDRNELEEFISTYLSSDDDIVRLTIGHNQQDCTYCGLLDMEGIEYHESTAYGYVLELVFGDLNPLKRIKADVNGGLYSLKQICNDWVDVITTPMAVDNDYSHRLVPEFLGDADDFKFDKSLAGEEPSVYDVLEVYAEAMVGSLRQVGGSLCILTENTRVASPDVTEVKNVLEGVSYTTGRAYNTFEYSLKGDQVQSKSYKLMGVDSVVHVERGKKCSTLPSNFYSQKDRGYRRGRGDQDYYERASHSSRPSNSFITKKGYITPAVSETKREQYLLGVPIYNEEYIDGALAFGRLIDVDISRVAYRKDIIKGVIAQLEEVKKGITYGKLTGPTGDGGGRNLLLKSNMGLSNSDYYVGRYYISDPSMMIAGETYTIQIWGEAEGADFSESLYLYNSGGNTEVANIQNRVNGVWKQTFKWRDDQDKSNISLVIFRGANHPNYKKGSKTSITRIKLEKGSIATDWTPAPEDVVVLMRDYYLAIASYWDILAVERNSPKDAENAKALRAEADKLGESDRFVKDIEAMRRLFTRYIADLNGIIANKEESIKQLRELEREPVTAIAVRRDDTSEWRSGFVVGHGKDLFNLESTAPLKGLKAKIKAKGNKTPITINIGGGTAVLGDDIRDFLDKNVPELYMSKENEIPHLLLEVDITCSGGGKSYILNDNSQSEKVGTKWVVDDTIAPKREHNYLDLGQVLSEELGATINLPPLPAGVDTIDVVCTGKWYVGFENFTWAVVEGGKDFYNLFRWSEEIIRRSMIEKYEQLCKHDWGIIFYINRFEVSQGLDVAYKDRRATLKINAGRQFDEVLTYETRIGTALGTGANLLDRDGNIVKGVISDALVKRRPYLKALMKHEALLLHALALLYSRRYRSIEFTQIKFRLMEGLWAFVGFIDKKLYFVEKYEFDLSRASVTYTARQVSMSDDRNLMKLAEQASLAMTAGVYANENVGSKGVNTTITGRRVGR